MKLGQKLVYFQSEITFLTIGTIILFSGVNLTVPSGDCERGYYCVSGADKPNPLMLNDTQCPEGSVHPIIGHICPTGHFCPTGSSFPQACAAGFYQVKYLFKCSD